MHTFVVLSLMRCQLQKTMHMIIGDLGFPSVYVTGLCLETGTHTQAEFLFIPVCEANRNIKGP